MSRAQLFDYEEISARYAATPGRSHRQRALAVAEAVGCSFPTVERAIRGLPGGASTGGPTPLGVNNAIVPKITDAAVLEKRTRFPSTVRDVGTDWLLKGGEHAAKIGGRIVKGPWKGFPVYTLTLEERATCPVSCRHWASCFGNNMHLAHRWRHGPALEWRLRREVASLELDHPQGFALRIHVLGDFYSVEYVEMWRELLERHPALHCFGFTAHVDPNEDEIAYRLALLVRDYWTRAERPRFAIRFSNAPVYVRSTLSLESPVQKPADVIICPAQYTPSGKKAKDCSHCGLCWDSARRIGFLQH